VDLPKAVESVAERDLPKIVKVFEILGDRVVLIVDVKSFSQLSSCPAEDHIGTVLFPHLL
jgi:hypothetical protein